MKRKILLTFAGISIAILITIALISTFANPSVKAQSPAPALSTAHVTTITASKDQAISMDFVGTVKAIDQIKVLPATSGQIINSRVSDGDAVKQGDLLFQISGINGTKPPLQAQYELAQTNFSNAQKTVDSIKEGNSTALKSAQLQVQSARHQAQALTQDLKVYNRNIDAAGNTLSLLQNNLSATDENNQQNLNKADLTIQGLIDSVNMLDAQRNKTFNDFSNQMAAADDSTARDALQRQIDAAGMDFDQKFRTLNNQIQIAQTALESSQPTSQLADNQVQAQIIQNQAQQDVLNLNQNSTALKAGYDGKTTDALNLAEVGAAATLAKNKANLLQAQTQLDLAKAALDTAQTQLEYLTIHSPIDGIVTQISVRPGDLVNTQSIVAQIVNPQGFELHVGVNTDDVSQITASAVEIGGRYLDVPIKNISPIADPTSKLVDITLELPNIFFRANQTLSTRLSFKQPSVGKTDAGAFMIPLDALVIDDSNAKFLFIDNNGIAQKTPVIVGDINGNNVAILSGIQDNDQIIVQGSQTLSDGQEVLDVPL